MSVNPAFSARQGASALNQAAVLLGLTIAAMLFGLIAVTNSPIFIALAVGLLVGVALLARPAWMIWLVLVAGLLIVGVIPIWAEGATSKASWGVSLLGFALMGAAFFRAATHVQATQRTPVFVWTALIFLIYTLFVSLINWASAYEVLAGFKRYFQVYGLIFALAWLPISEIDISRWRKLFILIVLIQFPWAAYELIKIVPLREGLRYAYPGMVPIDVVAGTFGATLTGGGGSGEMALFLIVVLLFLLSHGREGSLSRKRIALMLPVVLAPIFMGETKVVIVLLPLAFLVFYRRELVTRPHVALFGLMFCALLTIVAGYAYVTTMNKSLDELVARTLAYNVYGQGHGGLALNRTTVLTFWAHEQGLSDPSGAILGHGLGSAHDITGGHIARRYPDYGIGLTTASTLLWEQGIFGICLFLMILVFAWQSANRVRQLAERQWVRADAAAIQSAIPLLMFYIFYRPAALESLPFQIFIFTIFGYLAWLARQHRKVQT